MCCTLGLAEGCAAAWCRRLGKLVRRARRVPRRPPLICLPLALPQAGHEAWRLG